jgi:hypothetical protein
MMAASFISRDVSAVQRATPACDSKMMPMAFANAELRQG